MTNIRNLRWVFAATILSGTAEAQERDTLALRPMTVFSVTDTATTPASHATVAKHPDKPVQVLYCPEPSYPIALAEYGFEGSVTFNFVVDTLGYPEVEDMVVVESSNDGFIPNARRAVSKCRFRPAREAGRPVRMLVQQRVFFRRWTGSTEQH